MLRDKTRSMVRDKIRSERRVISRFIKNDLPPLPKACCYRIFFFFEIPMLNIHSSK